MRDVCECLKELNSRAAPCATWRHVRCACGLLLLLRAGLLAWRAVCIWQLWQRIRRKRRLFLLRRIRC